MNKILRAGDVCVDIGANIGYDSLLAAQCVGKSGSVIAIEASPAIYKLLNVNIKQNEMSQIRSVNLAASNFSGDISLYYGGDQNIGATTTVKSRGFPGVGVIKALPVIDILSNDEMSRARLIKIDIEGGELPVLDNIITNIDRFSNEINLIVEASAHEDEIGWANITNRFLARGFKLYEIENSYEVTWYLQNHQEYKLNSLDKMPSRQVDILFTRTNLEEFQLLF
jgi:FkbM family methyltransferase